ncbi:hypothetical protein HXX76_001005 [Chlamydomonas incerta]|uniref:Uncharacterized protein n=1 Tax=Chlamydomonas incerta TaxID=51695 RepID=A0A836B135_CHLIN|nr:hypothetical protein HXX76_001005 [Chlamydomonas incerta]|eukprot:KAG2444248.1 hypothetical protein HXX76_001005 [Chlamydomonas incerta]
MLFSQDQGLVLYERVISTRAENQLLQKLTKPKYYHHPTTVPAKKGDGSPRRGAAHSSLAAAQHAAHPHPPARHVSPHAPHGPAHQHHSTATHHAVHGGSSFSAPTSRPGSAAAGGAAGAGPPGSAGTAGTASSSSWAAQAPGTHRPTSGRSQALASTPPEGSARAQEAGRRAVAAAAAAAAAPGGGQRHRRSRSMSPGQAAAAAGSGGGHGGPHRKPLYPEDGPLKDYFSKERASVTATTVFTWGNRYKIGSAGTGSGVSGAGGGSGGGGGGKKSGRGGGGNGGGGGSDPSAAFTSYAPTQHKPPLRL